MVYLSKRLPLLANNGISLPTDLWVPTTSVVRPIRSHQYSLGVNAASPSRLYSLTLEGYYRQLSNLIEYKQGASFIDTTTS